jgi:hypothetical protein
MSWMSAEDLHARLHGVCRKQDLRNEQDAVPEVDPDDLHARDQGVVQDLRGREPTIEEDLRALHDLIPHAVVEVVVHLLDKLVV